MKELFEIEHSKSPRLNWIEKHNVGHSYNGMEEKQFQFMAWIGMNPTPKYPSGYGSTLQEALCDLAKRNNIPLWNEEEFANQQKTKERYE